MKKKVCILLAVIVVCSLFSGTHVFATASDKQADYREVFDRRTGEIRIVDINAIDEPITLVYISFGRFEAKEVVESNGTRSTVFQGTIYYTVFNPFSGGYIHADVECRQTPTLLSQSGNTLEFSHLWSLTRVDSGLSYGANYTLYGDLGYTKYTNGLVVDKNYFSPANWGIQTGAYALANNFYVTNPEFFGGDSWSSLDAFIYS